MSKKRNLIVAILLIVGANIYTGKGLLARSTLLVGAIPDQNPEKLNRLYGLLSSELSEKLDVPVKYIPVINYPAAVTAFRTRSLDLVWFGGLTGVQARLQTPASIVIAQRDIDANFRSVFIANSKGGIPEINNISELKLLKGKRFTFGSESSTSGRLMPQYFLEKAGVKPKDFKGGHPGFSGSHDATLALVKSGSYEAGAMNEEVWKANVNRGKVDLSQVNVIWRTPPYADYHWLAQADLDKRFRTGFTTKLRNVLISLSKESKNQKIILDLFGANKFIPAYPEQYKQIEQVGRSLGKIK